jgi:hypothetical protein
MNNPDINKKGKKTSFLKPVIKIIAIQDPVNKQ